jgi:hypothetical protein
MESCVCCGREGNCLWPDPLFLEGKLQQLVVEHLKPCKAEVWLVQSNGHVSRQQVHFHVLIPSVLLAPSPGRSQSHDLCSDNAIPEHSPLSLWRSFIHSDSRADEPVSHSAVLFHLYEQIWLTKHVEMKWHNGGVWEAVAGTFRKTTNHFPHTRCALIFGLVKVYLFYILPLSLNALALTLSLQSFCALRLLV